MFIPIGDTPNPRGTPVINYLIIGINVAVFLFITIPLSTARPDMNDPALIEYVKSIPNLRTFMLPEMLNHISAYDIFVFEHGFRTIDPSLYDLFFSMFLHGGWMHLFGNMLFLWIYGDNVEHRLGSLRYLLSYIGTGVAATLFYLLFQPNSQIPMVGASGAISGVLGFYFIFFPRNKVKMFIFLFPWFMDVVVIPARFVLGFYLLIDNILPFMLASKTGGIAYGAHIGGFLAGLGVAYMINRFSILKKLTA